MQGDPDARADQVPEDHEIQAHADARWQDGLQPDAQKAVALLDEDGAEGDAVEARTKAAWTRRLMKRCGAATATEETTQ